MKKTTPFILAIALTIFFLSCKNQADTNGLCKTKQADSMRIAKMLDLKWGLFLHWSLGTFSGTEWTQNVSDPAFFKATSVNTDQWCSVAKEAGMGYIIFVTKHPDGFCLWDTKTTEFKVTNSALKKDVLAELRKSCDKYGIKLCLYFSEGQWNWPDYENPEVKAAQLEELFTQYGEIGMVWMDVAVWDGGLNHTKTTEIIKKYQPDCFIGYNHGLPSGDLQSREMGNFGKLVSETKTNILSQREIDSLVTENEKHVRALEWEKAAEQEKILSASYDGYLLAENSVCINQYKGKWFWFYNDATKDNAISADTIFKMYQQSVSSGVLFSLATGPDKNGELRAVDVERLKKAGEEIKKRYSK